MSDYTPRKGDRVRVVIEGEVTEAPWSDRFKVGASWADGNIIIPAAEHVVSVERLAPKLPTIPGTVVWIDGDAYQRRTERWYCGPSIGGLSDADVQDRADRHGFDVLRGAES